MILRAIYLILAAVGTVWPMFYFISWFNENTWSLSAMLDAWVVNLATEGMLYDLLVAAIATSVGTLAHAVQRRDWRALVCIPATFCIGVSCGVPLLLWFRSRSDAARAAA